jgi:catechol 2,3-dioxygenase-like lactoylglutathione lyase family enzyme
LLQHFSETIPKGPAEATLRGGRLSDRSGTSGTPLWMANAFRRGRATVVQVARAKSRYVDPTEQLVTEVVVLDIKRSVAFYRSLGFELLRDAGDFVELTWQDHRLFLAEVSAFQGIEPAELVRPAEFPVANVRVMVPNVDDFWKVASDVGARVVVPIGDRYYGLRDFTIADPDGFGIRFASLLDRGQS